MGVLRKDGVERDRLPEGWGFILGLGLTIAVGGSGICATAGGGSSGNARGLRSRSTVGVVWSSTIMAASAAGSGKLKPSIIVSWFSSMGISKRGDERLSLSFLAIFIREAGVAGMAPPEELLAISC